MTELERTKPESPVSESERALPAVIVSTGGYVPSWLQQAWQSDWFRSNIMASYECWVWLRGTIRATMADKTLSTPQRSEGPFHACPGAGRAAESWWPAGSLAPVQPNAVSTLRPLWAAGRMGTQGCRVYVTHVGTYTHMYTLTHTWRHQFLVLTRASLDDHDVEGSFAKESQRKKEGADRSICFLLFLLAFADLRSQNSPSVKSYLG